MRHLAEVGIDLVKCRFPAMECERTASRRPPVTPAHPAIVSNSTRPRNKCENFPACRHRKNTPTLL